MVAAARLLIPRLMPMAIWPKLLSAVLVVPFEEADPSTADPLVAMFEKSLAYLEVPLVAKLLVSGVTKRGEVRKHPGRLEEALRIGRGLI